MKLLVFFLFLVLFIFAFAVFLQQLHDVRNSHYLNLDPFHSLAQLGHYLPQLILAFRGGTVFVGTVSLWEGARGDRASVAGLGLLVARTVAIVSDHLNINTTNRFK